MNAQPLQDTLLSLISHRAKIYEGRVKSEVIRLRAYVLLAISDTGNAHAALPDVCDYVRNADDYGLAYEAGVGARAAGTLGPAGRELLDDLVILFYREFSEPEFSLDRYSLEFPAQEATTAKLEIIKAFQQIGFKNNERVEKLLQTCALSDSSSSSASRLAEAASRILRDTANQHSGGMVLNEPLKPETNRASIDLHGKLEIDYVDQNGRSGKLVDLIDRPTAIVFFYTRCTNSQKCSAAVSQIAQLQQMLSDQDVRENVRLLGITFEPKSDDAIRLKNYGLGRNVRFNDSTQFLRLDPAQHATLITLLEVPVSYSDGWVNTHGILLVIINENHQLVARYESVAWENAAVLRELVALENSR
ncbi:MAG: SCO family protein [Pirellulaceae bacterium]|nr:SCO family protein [Pirellulaceae bacterium]